MRFCLVLKLTMYLWCRNLMAKDEFKNLGFAEEKPAEAKKEDGKGSKGGNTEILW